MTILRRHTEKRRENGGWGRMNKLYQKKYKKGMSQVKTALVIQASHVIFF
jgi:hypothetical protein